MDYTGYQIHHEKLLLTKQEMRNSFRKIKSMGQVKVTCTYILGFNPVGTRTFDNMSLGNSCN